MKIKLICLLLAASVAFNIFFAIGYQEAKSEMELSKTRRGRDELLRRELDLDAQQQKAYEEMQANYAAQRQGRRKDIRAQYSKFWAAIMQDEPDEKALEEFIQAASDGKARRRRSVERMKTLMKILRPEQREHVRESIRSRYRGSKKKQ